MSLLKTGFIGTFLLLSLFSLSACSNNKTASRDNGSLQNSEKQGGWQNKATHNKTSSNKSISNMQKVEIGKIVSIKTIAIQPEKIDSYGSVGVSVGSGGRSGLYGAFDLATLGKVFRNANKPKTAQRFIIRKSNGEMVAITQPFSQASKEVFKIGDSVKILLENGKAKVIH